VGLATENGLTLSLSSGWPSLSNLLVACPALALDV
jgi:hypothetical protein